MSISLISLTYSNEMHAFNKKQSVRKYLSALMRVHRCSLSVYCSSVPSLCIWYFLLNSGLFTLGCTGMFNQVWHCPLYRWSAPKLRSCLPKPLRSLSRSSPWERGSTPRTTRGVHYRSDAHLVAWHLLSCSHFLFLLITRALKVLVPGTNLTLWLLLNLCFYLFFKINDYCLKIFSVVAFCSLSAFMALHTNLHLKTVSVKFFHPPLR